MATTVVFDPATGQASLVVEESTVAFDPMGIMGDGSRLSRTRGVAAGTAGYAGEGMKRLTLESYVVRYNRLLEELDVDPTDPNLPPELQTIRDLIGRVSLNSGLTDAAIQQFQQQNLGSVRREWFAYQDDLGISDAEMSSIFGEIISSLIESGLAITPGNFFELRLPNHPRFQEFNRMLDGDFVDPDPAGGSIPTNNGPSHGRPDRGELAVDDAPDQPIKTGVVTSTKGTGGAVTIYKDRTHIQDGDGYTGHGIQAPVILDLDGDGVEVAFGEDIYFDLDDDGFLEQTSWAAADDGFLVIDLNADGTRGAGDGVIDQSNELVLSSLGLEGARRGGLASGVVDQGRGFGERF